MTPSPGKWKKPLFLAIGFFRGCRENNSIPSSKRTHPPITPIRAPFANQTILFFCSRESASTPVENIAIIGYFEEIRDLIRKKPVNLAGFIWSLFLPRVLCHRTNERQPEARYCPPIRSRRIIGGILGFFRFFWVLPWFGFFVDECVSGSRTKIVSIMFMCRTGDHRPQWCFFIILSGKLFHKKYFPDFFRYQNSIFSQQMTQGYGLIAKTRHKKSGAVFWKITTTTKTLSLP